MPFNELLESKEYLDDELSIINSIDVYSLLNSLYDPKDSLLTKIQTIKNSFESKNYTSMYLDIQELGCLLSNDHYLFNSIEHEIQDFFYGADIENNDAIILLSQAIIIAEDNIKETNTFNGCIKALSLLYAKALFN